MQCLAAHCSLGAFQRATGAASSRRHKHAAWPSATRHTQQQNLIACHAGTADRQAVTAGRAVAAAVAALVLHMSTAVGVVAQPPAAPLQQELQAQQACSLQRQPQADLAGLFDSPNDVDPFTLYGTNFKKYQIEQMQGEKVISRSRGFTVDSCVSAVVASEETPEFNGLPTGEKVQAGDDLLCKRATGPDLNKACKQSCADACTDALAKYEERMFAETGYKLEPKERERVLRNCRHSCSYECTKSGKAHDFVVPYRR